MPIYGRLLSWIVLNLLLVLAAVLVLVPDRLGLGWAPYLTLAARERLQAIGESIASDIAPVLTEEWKIDLQRFDRLYEMEFAVYDGRGVLVAGTRREPPREVMQELRKSRALMAPDLPAAVTAPAPAAALPVAALLPQELPGWPRPEHAVLLRWMFVIRDHSGGRYWIGVRVPVNAPDGGLIPATVVASTPSFWHAVRFLDLSVWVDISLTVIGLSVLLWLPLMWGLSGSARRLIAATERIGNGQFDARVRLSRRDELGQLADALNTVAERLDSFLTSQKHFLANIAHEVSSPLGRLQLALEILQQHLRDEGEEAYRDVHEEVQIMSELVNELLAFSRVGIGEQKPALSSVSLHALMVTVLQREDPGGKVLMAVPHDLQVRANIGLLGRALGNLVRNALRYAGTANGPIEVNAGVEGKTALIVVSDHGPGVPELALLKLGDPFYRPEGARRRTTGGIGLGLATVRNCVAACGGRVSFRNRKEGGFEAEIVIPREELR